MATGFLVHAAQDSIGVAIVDLLAAERVEGAYHDGRGHRDVEVVDDIPLGNKIALTDVPAGQPVVKYGTPIGLVTADIRAGEHVHTHNLRGQRWAR